MHLQRMQELTLNTWHSTTGLWQLYAWKHNTIMLALQFETSEDLTSG